MAAVPQTSRWIVCPRPQPMAAARIFCFPYAGVGGSAFRGWGDALQDVEVCLVQAPGREGRIHEKPIGDLSALVPEVVANITPWLDRPFAFYGHSLGALIAFETARALREAAAGHQPDHLFVSASRAPHLPWVHPPVRHLGDLDLLAEVDRRYGSVPRQVVEDPELRGLVVPALRADFALVETHRYKEGAPLACPISAFGGADDPMVPEAALEAWRRQTSKQFTLRILRGNHLFLDALRLELLALISSDLKRTWSVFSPH